MVRTWHSMEIEDVFKELKSSKEGLHNDVARGRINIYGRNELKSKKKISALKIFVRQFKSFLVLLLVIAILVSVLIGYVMDAAVIAVIVIINAILGFVQEFRAEKTMDALRKLSAPMANVVRDGKEVKIPSSELVLGDIILLEDGDKVPADARIIESFGLKADESSLTGESTTVSKSPDIVNSSAALGDRRNLIFMNTVITEGRATAIVVSTGMNTEVGHIANLVQSVEERETPLQQKLAGVGRSLGIAIIVIAVAIFGLGIIRGIEAFEMFIVAVSLAVAAVPEGLPAVVTITLAIGLSRMAKAKAIVRRLPVVETLGSATVICADKTGTLTENEMTVRQIYSNNLIVDVTGGGYNPVGYFLNNGGRFNATDDKNFNLLLTAGVLCTTARLNKYNNKWSVRGDPTEGALLVAAEKAGISKENLLVNYKQIGEIPFDANRKMMSVIFKDSTNKNIAYVKGAPEIILEKSTRIFKDGRVKELTKKDREEIISINNQMTENALRVLGVAYRIIPDKIKDYSSENIESDLIFIGLEGMIDPPRPEAKEAIAISKRAGIKVVMITGDHPSTARAIAKDLGILDLGHVVIGSVLDKFSDEEFSDHVENISVYARVSPEHKVRILEALRSKGHIVAMTGDGVNDAPALKHADIGVAMGVSGTDVAKEASDMVLQDDNFATIVEAIREGRNIYQNIRNFVRYLISSNVGEILAIFAASLIGLPLPLIAVQILWMNLLTDGLPALALGVDPPSNEIMSNPPRDPKEKVINKDMWKFISIVGLVISIGTIFVFYESLHLGETYARTMAFSTIVMFQMFNVFNSRTEGSIFHKSFWSNKYLLLAILSSVLLQLLVVYVPFFQELFKTTALGVFDWFGVLAAGSIVVIVVELKKLLTNQSHFSYSS